MGCSDRARGVIDRGQSSIHVGHVPGRIVEAVFYSTLPNNERRQLRKESRGDRYHTFAMCIASEWQSTRLS